MFASPDSPAIVACAVRVAALIPRLGSNYDGEVVATARAICRVLMNAGLDLHDLGDGIRLGERLPVPAQPSVGHVAPCRVDERNWRRVICWLQCHSAMLTNWEASFVASLARFRNLSTKQQVCLAGILEKVRGASRC